VLNESDKGLPHTIQPSRGQTRAAILSTEKMQRIASKLEHAMKEDKLFYKVIYR